jgi:hypothetical protein
VYTREQMRVVCWHSAGDEGQGRLTMLLIHMRRCARRWCVRETESNRSAQRIVQGCGPALVFLPKVQNLVICCRHLNFKVELGKSGRASTMEGSLLCWIQCEVWWFSDLFLAVVLNG